MNNPKQPRNDLRAQVIGGRLVLDAEDVLTMFRRLEVSCPHPAARLVFRTLGDNLSSTWLQFTDPRRADDS